MTRRNPTPFTALPASTAIPRRIERRAELAAQIVRDIEVIRAMDLDAIGRRIIDLTQAAKLLRELTMKGDR